MPSQEDWILSAARLFPSPTPDHIRTSDVPLVLICLDIDDEDLSIRRALGVGRVREIPVANLVRVLSPILPAENSASERYTMFKTFDKYERGTVGLADLQRVAVGAGLLTARECSRIMSTVANTGKGITFDHWCHLLQDETGEEEDMKKTDLDSFLQQNLNASQSGSSTRNPSLQNSPKNASMAASQNNNNNVSSSGGGGVQTRPRGSSRIMSTTSGTDRSRRSSMYNSASSTPPSSPHRAGSRSPQRFSKTPSFTTTPQLANSLEEAESIPAGMN